MTEHYSTIWQTLAKSLGYPKMDQFPIWVHHKQSCALFEATILYRGPGWGGGGGGGLCGCRCLCQLSVIIMSIRKLQLNFGSSSSCQLSGCMLII